MVIGIVEQTIPARRRGLLSIYAGVILLASPMLRGRPIRVAMTPAHISHSSSGNLHLPNLVRKKHRSFQDRRQNHSMVLRAALLRSYSEVSKGRWCSLLDPFS